MKTSLILPWTLIMIAILLTFTLTVIMTALVIHNREKLYLPQSKFFPFEVMCEEKAKHTWCFFLSQQSLLSGYSLPMVNKEKIVFFKCLTGKYTSACCIQENNVFYCTAFTHNIHVHCANQCPPSSKIWTWRELIKMSECRKEALA